MSGERECGVRGRGFPELSNRKLKEQALAFYSEHKVQEALEKLLNEMFLAEPQDVYGYMSEYFHGLSIQPVISTLSVREGLDSTGGKSLELDLYCTINGKDKFSSSASVSLDMYDSVAESLSQLTSSTATKGAARRGTPKGRGSKSSLEQGELTSSHASSTASNAVTTIDSLKSVRKYICPLVQGLSPYKLSEVDEALRCANVADGTQLHPSSLLAVSSAVAVAGANLSNTPLYLHLAKYYTPPKTNQSATPTQTRKRSNSRRSSRIKSTSNQIKYTMPIPVVGALSGGHMGCGKARFKEFCVTPLPGTPFPEQIRMILSVHSELGRTLVAKYGPSGQGSLSSGSYCPVIDKAEQALDFIQDAARNAGFELNKSVGILIDVGADKLYDEEKGKYELISGQWKNSDDIINMYSDLLRSYPGLLGYIDPLHQNDIDGWRKLQDRLGNDCFLIADNTLKKGLPVQPTKHSDNGPDNAPLTETPEGGTDDESPTDQQGTGSDNQVTDEVRPSLSYLSCSTITLETTLSGTMCTATHIKDQSYYVMLRVPPNSTMNTLPADLAVAMQCRFLRVSAPTGLTSSGILSRLGRIREELVAKKLHDPAGAHVFTCNPYSVEGEHQTVT